jgi:acyl-CoA hydrolase
VDHVEFQSPIRQGEIVTLRSRVNRAFTTSMEVEINVWAENSRDNTVRKCNRAFYTFVAVDDNNHPVPVPPIVAETEAEKRCYANAAKRREVRLILSGRLSWGDTTHIKEELLSALTER